jgi:hypothetical protein
MDPTVLQTSILVAYANANLQGKKAEFLKNHPAAYHYQSLRFLDRIPPKDVGYEKYTADNPMDWFKFLIKKKYKRLYLHYNSRDKSLPTDPINKLCSKNDCNWVIIAEKEENYDIWIRTESYKQGINKSIYHILVENFELPEIKILSLDTTKLYLTEIFTDLIEFTKRNKLQNWEKIFQNAKDYLSNTNSNDLLAEGYLPEDCFSLETQQILAACDMAWVFGGMGSWNDLSSVDDYDLYNRLTANLWDTLCKSIAAAINSYPAKG